MSSAVHCHPGLCLVGNNAVFGTQWLYLLTSLSVAKKKKKANKRWHFLLLPSHGCSAGHLGELLETPTPPSIKPVPSQHLLSWSLQDKSLTWGAGETPVGLILPSVTHEELFFQCK